jgi:ABC-type multidrug transport system fused ATPase/permease subunit
MDEGQVAELGTHEELIALEGLYSSLVKLQVTVFITPTDLA